jgi:seryl-tRNA synthetase
MDGGNKVIGLWRGRDSAHAGAPAPHLDAPSFTSEELEEAALSGRWRKPVALGVCTIAAIAWLSVVGYARFLAWSSLSPSIDDVVTFVATASAPLALIAMIWMLAMRSSRAESSRFAQTAFALRSESERMDSVLAFVSARIDASRRDLSEQGDSLTNLGNDTAKRLSSVSESLRKEIEAISGQTQALKGTAAAARGDLAVLLSNLPKAQVQMRQIATSLVEAGTTAQDKAVALAEQVAALGSHSLDAQGVAETVARDLAKQLEEMLSTSNALAGMIDEGQSRLLAAGGDSTNQLAQRIKDIGVDVDRISSTFTTQDEASRSLVTRISSDLGDLETRFAAFDAHGKERTAQLGSSLTELQSHAEALRASLVAGDENVIGLTSKTDALLAALDSAAREIDETMPAAYVRLEASAEKAMSVVGKAGPALSDIAAASESTLTHLTSAEAIVSRQQASLVAMNGEASATLAACKEQADALASSIATATAELKAITAGASADLLESLIRARDTARQAADNARETFSEVIPVAAASFGEHSKQALGDALTAQVEAQMSEIAATTEKAVAAAQKATDRLMRQMLTISETSAALEARISEAKDEAERGDQSNFARRVALLIESLNSSAIDVTKILSNDVTDTAWASYLRGDRGVFARRAVKLLDASEAKEVAKHYSEDSDFREQVNRYIHDYESMLRNVMATRDGNPLSVALLSADTGKLYVALAQAIERLRS